MGDNKMDIVKELKRIDKVGKERDKRYKKRIGEINKIKEKLSG